MPLGDYWIFDSRAHPISIIFAKTVDVTDSRPRDDDVTCRAHEFLFELITIHAETTLADIFRLMEASPLLQKLYFRDFAEELCMEARKGATKPSASERAAHEGIEFLELYPDWGQDTSTSEYSGRQRLHLHGIRFASCLVHPDTPQACQSAYVPET